MSLAASAAVTPAFAQTQAVDARTEIAVALYAASATQAASERAADARLRAARAEIERLQAQGASARTALAAAQERYVTDLAAKDRVYAQEIAAFRSAMQEIAATPEARRLVRKANKVARAAGSLKFRCPFQAPAAHARGNLCADHGGAGAVEGGD